jgi:hypothetical protein
MSNGMRAILAWLIDRYSATAFPDEALGEIAQPSALSASHLK